MKHLLALVVALASSLSGGVAWAAWPAVPPALPPPAGPVVVVRTEAQLQAAVRELRPNTTISIAPGTYRLTRTLAIAGHLENVALRGATNNRDDVVLVGPGRDVESSAVPHGVWVSGDVRRLLIANLTIRDVYFHPICLNPGPRAPRIYNVHLVNGGQQLIKSNPAPDGTGVDDAVVEYSLLEYDPTARDAYANAIDVHGGARWVIRNNLVRNVRPPGGGLAGPAVLLWNHTADAVVEANTFINCQRAISLGLIVRPGHDNTGGIVRNNFIYQDQSVAGADVAIGVMDSPGSKVLHNTILQAGSYPNAIEYRFAGTTGVVIAGNLCNGAVAARDGATASVRGNETSATPALFVNARGGDLRLLASAARATGGAAPEPDAATDWDGRPRPAGGASHVGAWEPQPGTPPLTPLDLVARRPPAR